MIPTTSLRTVFGLFAALSLCVAWLIPNHYPPWLAFHGEMAAFGGLVLLSAAMMSSRTSPGLPPVAWVLIAVATIPWLQWSAAKVPFSGDAWVSTLYLLGLALAIATGFAWSRSNVRCFAALLAGAALTAAVVSSFIALVQCLELGAGGLWMADMPPGSRATANLAQPNNLATLIAFGALGLWALYEQRRIGGFASYSLLALLLIGAALTQSRTALLFGPTIALIHFVARRNRVVWRIGIRSLLVVVALQLLCNLLWPVASRSLELGFASDVGLAQAGLKTGRTIVWPILVDAIWQSPWTGYGWLQNGAAQLAVAERHPQGEELFLHAHNLFLDLLIWCGLPLGMVLIGLLLWWFASRVRSVASREAAIGMMVVAVLGVHAMLELPHHYAYFLIPAGLWAGLVEAERQSQGWLSWRFAPLLAIATATLAIGVAWDYAEVEEDFRLVRFENLSIGTLRASQPAPYAPMLSTLTAYLRVARIPIKPGMSMAELQSFEVLVRRYPYSTLLYRYAKALALNGRLDDARRIFVKLRHIHGEIRYQSLLRTLRQEIDDGHPELKELEAALPR